MLIEVNLSTHTIQMIEAYKVFTKKQTSDVTDIVADIVSTGIKSKLADVIGIDAEPTQLPSPNARPSSVTKIEPVNHEHYEEDVTNISSGLGGADNYENDIATEPVEIQGSKDVDAMLPDEARPQGPTSMEKSLDADLQVGQPKVEAKAQATFADQMKNESPSQAMENFVSNAGFGEIYPEDVDPRILRREKGVMKGKGKVSLMMETDKESY